MNLLVYGESRSLPRAFDGVHFQDTYISLLGKKHNVLLRGAGGASSAEILQLFKRDMPYVSGQSDIILITFLGIVDGAPRPFTYMLKGFWPKRFWARILRVISPFRPIIQKLGNYKLVSLGDFMNNLSVMIEVAINNSWKCIVVENPLPPDALEMRSPGIRSSIKKYNDGLRSVVKRMKNENVFWVEFQDAHFVSSEDGHHLSREGHADLAARINECLKQIEQSNQYREEKDDA